MRSIGVALSPTESKFGPLLYSGNLEKGLETAAELGYDGVEISIRDSDALDRESIIEKIYSLNLSVFAIATGQSYISDGYFLFSLEEEKRNRAISRLRGHIDFATKLESMVIIGGIAGTLDESVEKQGKQKRLGLEAVESVVEYSEKMDVVLLLEAINRYETNIINTAQDGLEIIEKIGSKKLALLLDTFHMNIEEKSFKESILLSGKNLGYIHLADSNRLAPGRGHLNFKKILSALDAAGYRGPVTFEVLPKPDDFTAASEAIANIRSKEKNA